jgi:hypothetical protein
MALASNPATATEGSTSPVDAYLLDVYRQAASTARPTAHPRVSSIGAFLAFVGLVTAALAVLFSVPEGLGGPLTPAAGVALGVIGLVGSIVFYAFDVRRHRAFGTGTGFDGPTYATSSIYQASIGFFGFVIVIAAALLQLR